MENTPPIPKIILIVCLLCLTIIGYDLARPWLHPRAPVPSESTLEAEAARHRDSDLATALMISLGSKSWGLTVVLPSPQRQSKEHDEVLASLFVGKDYTEGALRPLGMFCSQYKQIVYTVDKFPADISDKTAKEGYGEIRVFDTTDKKNPRLVYREEFPYHGEVDSKTSKWTSSQMLARQLTITIQRWNQQVARSTP